MDNDEVICISSDDEDPQQQCNSNADQQSSSKKAYSDGSLLTKKEVLSEEEKEKEIGVSKRSISEIAGETTCNTVQKKLKPSSAIDEDGSTANKVSDNTESETVCQEEQHVGSVPKPKLLVKEKHRVEPDQQDAFSMFISLCLQKDRSPDMHTIVDKLKRRYEQLDPAYVHSEVFRNYLNEKRFAMMEGSNKVYCFIFDVMSEMKNSVRGKSKLVANGTCPKGTGLLSKPSTSSKFVQNDDKERSTDPNNKHAGRAADIERLELVMKKCQQHIKKLEESETNFDDEENSNYIKLEKYKFRMIELFTQHCKLTGENADAGRPYLRPKHLNPTGISAVDQAITNFINAKISKRNKLKKIGSFPDAVIFPDYADILQCIAKCNESRNLGLTTKKQEQIAKKAFTQLGEYLQRVRRNDYWDTFSSYLEEKEEDPAAKDPNLAEKLMQNRVEGEKRLANVFQTYVEKQEAQRNQVFEEETSDDEEDEDRSTVDEKERQDDDTNENDISLSTEGDKNNVQEDTDDTSKEKDLSIDSTARVNNVHSTENNKIDIDIIELDGSAEANDNGSATNESSSHDKTCGVKETIANDTGSDPDATEKTEPGKEMKINALTIRNNASDSSGSLSSVKIVTIHNSGPEEKIIPDIATEESENDAPLDEEPEDCKEEKKPLLRVCSFAKPPTTWKDGQQENERPTRSANGARVPNIEDVIDLTTSPPVTANRTGTSVPNPVSTVKVKRQKFTTLSGVNITNVNNIKNNNLKVGLYTVSVKGHPKLHDAQSLATVNRVIGMNGSTVVRRILPKSGRAGQQVPNQSAAAKNPQQKQGELVIRLVQPSDVPNVPKRVLEPSLTTPSTSKLK